MENPWYGYMLSSKSEKFQGDVPRAVGITQVWPVHLDRNVVNMQNEIILMKGVLKNDPLYCRDR